MHGVILKIKLSECIRGSYDDALYKSTCFLLAAIECMDIPVQCRQKL